MQFAFEFDAAVLAAKAVDAHILGQLQAVEARVVDTSLPSDGTVRRVQLQLHYTPSVFVRPGTEFKLPMLVHSWKRSDIEQS